MPEYVLFKVTETLFSLVVHLKFSLPLFEFWSFLKDLYTSDSKIKHSCFHSLDQCTSFPSPLLEPTTSLKESISVSASIGTLEGFSLQVWSSFVALHADY